MSASACTRCMAGYYYELSVMLTNCDYTD